MTDAGPGPVVVVGAGVFGLCAALGALAAGRTVEVFDPDPEGESASAVAAGMIAPLAETLLEDAPLEDWPLLRRARDLWPALQEVAPGLEIRRPGARIALGPAAEAVSRRLEALLARHDLAVEARRGKAGLVVTTAEDWSLDPRDALARLRAAVLGRGGRLRAEAFTPEAALDALEAKTAGAVVVACGYASRRFAALAPELARLEPIKGHSLRFPAERGLGPVERTERLYFSPQPSGLVVGATMEPGRADAEVDPAAVAALLAEARASRPALAAATPQAQAGVRAGYPDGRPLIGPAARPGLLLATGARRNGWLFGALVALSARAYFTGEASPEPAVDPRRGVLESLGDGEVTA